MPTPGTTTQICPPLDTLDTLELVRSGALTLSDEHPATLDIPDRPEGPNLEIVDPEGVPLTRVRYTGRGPNIEVREVPTWLGRISPRPFEAMYLDPAAVRSRVPANALPVVVHGAVTSGELSALGTAPLLLLVLMGPSVDPTPAALSTMRSTIALAQSRPLTTVVAVPLTSSRAALENDLLERVVAAYSPRPAVHLGRCEADDVAASGMVLFFTGLSGSGKSTVARAVRNAVLETEGRPVSLLDGDVVRRHLSAGLGFSPKDRETNILRIGWVAAEIAYHGGLAICSPIAPYAATREVVRQAVSDRGGRFVLVHVSTPLDECERRDRKGLYARARRGEIPDFTGISAPYETPADADLTIDTTRLTVEDARDLVLRLIHGTNRRPRTIAP